MGQGSLRLTARVETWLELAVRTCSEKQQTQKKRHPSPYVVEKSHAGSGIDLHLLWV